ncbi:MAG: ATP-dependent sacrificial sulfur transferase LarE [Synechococcales cyanobacterium]
MVNAVVLEPALQQKYGAVKAQLRELSQVIIAYSGGVDSALVAKIAQDVLGDHALAITAVSPSLLPEDLDEAMQQAEWIGIRHELVDTHELDNPAYASNPSNRCYFCKSELHDTLKAIAAQSQGIPIVDGVNADDLHDYRPGIQAGQERGVISPLAQAGLSKLEVRQLSRALGLPWWDKPAQPCLSSRFPYGESIDLPKLHRVAAAERYLRHLGWRQVRVRSQGNTARIELPPAQIGDFVAQSDLPQVVATLQQAGFLYVTLDLEGYVSGKLNRVLTPSPLS